MSVLEKREQLEKDRKTFILYVLLNIIQELDYNKEYDFLPITTDRYKNWYHIESELKQMIENLK